MQSVMTPQQYFNHVAKPEIQRSTFDRSHGYKTTFDAGLLIPIFCEEALPGDTFNLKANIFGRLATPLKPIMDNIMLDCHFFSVPYRLVWENWQKFMGEQNNPGDSTDYLIPTVAAPTGGFLEMSNFDYLGIPTKINNIDVNSLPLRAMNLIWNEWYRDQNLQDSIPVPLGDGPDDEIDFRSPLPRGKRKDYFTSALPWAQKGTPVTVPLGDTAPITGTASGDVTRKSNGTYWLGYNAGDNAIAPGMTDKNLQINGAARLNVASGTGGPNAPLLSLDPNGSLTATVNGSTLSADLSSATAVTINALREAFQVQRMYEKDARGGTRYTEILRAHFNVISPDARLQRPEYLGGFTTNLNVTPIAQTSDSQDESTPQGNLAAMGTFSNHNKGFIKSFTEHEIVIGFLSARADLNYQQGLNRMWSRQTRFDFYWPTLAHLGEQAILNKEIYTQGTSADDDVFGYQERFAEYRYKPSQVTARFRSNSALSLDVWHLAQEFTVPPALNSAFIVENPPIDRIIAVEDEPQFIVDCFFKFIAARPMPTFATPGLIDHF